MIGGAKGIGLGLDFGIGNPFRKRYSNDYIDPAVKESLVGLWKFDQNTNESPTRNIIKNTIKDKGGDLELLNFGYKLNSGYGKYIEDFSLFALSNRFEYSEISNTKVTITAVSNNHTGIYHSVTEEDSALYWNTFKIKVSGSTDDVYISYVTNSKNIRLYNGINTVVVPNDLSWHAFVASATNVSCNITLEFVPEYEGALVTDGKDDMIVSQKIAQEMLGGSKEITVVSMIHQIGLHSLTTINNIRSESVAHVVCRNVCSSAGKTGIYGYSRQINTNNPPTLINNILGDKKDYTAEGNSALDPTDKFFVQGYKYNGTMHEVSPIAVYWTFMANKVLTTDEINQIIAYFRLDKYVTPQVIYDVKRQGLTNDTPAANWYLKDFSGNGHDMQLYNYAKKGNSGVGKYIEDFTVWTKIGHFVTITDTSLIVTNGINKNWLLAKISSNSTIESFKVKITGIPSRGTLIYLYTESKEDTEATHLNIKEDGVYVLPSTVITDANISIGFSVGYFEDYTGLTIEQIPDYEGALVSDGKDDYGQFVGDLGLKDYTIAVDRAYVEGLGAQVPIISSIGTTVNTPFLMEHMGVEKILAPHSFGTYTALSTLNTDRFISYQSTYKYNGDNLTKGTSTDTGSGLTIGRFGANNSQYAKLALWSFLLFPYTLSEFLLERQLKKYKLGTLYPDMVEVRPIVKSNTDNYMRIEYRNGYGGLIQPGSYLPVGSILRISVVLNNTLDEVSSLKVNGVDIPKSNYSGNNFWIYDATVTKSPQKINITIDEYIRFENIVQPYPEIWTITQNGNKVSWGDKLKVGSEFIIQSKTPLLPELYTSTNFYYNGNVVNHSTPYIVEKQMTFACDKTWKLNTTEPHAIYSPQKLNIPNSSYKILGYIPDLTGKGNHGRLNNFAYTEESGANEDGSIRIDGTDDHITISNVIGGKCIMAKVTINRNGGVIYDQRRANVPNKSWLELDLGTVAFEKNAVSTYIDGILNHNVICSDLVYKTVNLTCELEIGDTSGTYKPTIGSSYAVGYTTNINLYEFMLFPDVPDEEEIKELNEVMGIEENLFLIHLNNDDTEIINETLILNE